MTLLSGIADSAQLSELSNLLNDYANQAGIANDTAGRERLAERIMNIFNSGMVKAEDIRMVLDTSPHFWLMDNP